MYTMLQEIVQLGAKSNAGMCTVGLRSFTPCVMNATEVVGNESQPGPSTADLV